MHLEVDVPHKDVYVAIRDPFKAMQFGLEIDFPGRFRGCQRICDCCKSLLRPPEPAVCGSQTRESVRFCDVRS